MNRNFLFAGAALCAAALAPLWADDASLPKAETLLDKQVEATGGRAAYEKIRTMVTSGSMEVKGIGMKGTMTAYHGAPNKVLIEINIEGIGTIRDGSDGKVAWTVSSIQGPRIKEGDERAMELRHADISDALHWRDYYKSVVTEGIEKVDGKDCYKVVMTPKDGEGGPETQYIDKETNLPVKMAVTIKGPMGEIATETLVSDYRKEGDLLMPHKLVQKMAGQEIALTFDNVKFNVDLPKDKFDLPAEIQALLKKQ